ncbi:MAG: glutamine--fructose-6-phosphate transaminase (isomerizing) [Chloroflexi bacterium]|nr:glutamine--fructose-6-phosphate transaminase (isomerizing) [Chloroflexota bacterium]MBV9601151.1 glutamine--fructose-6-phosphate transaminase (isomerizing) [Chloroflexota bacterium]
MCGIFGYVGDRDEAPQLVLAGLKKLEYRGYDSWGIAARQASSAPARLLVDKHTGKIGQATTTLPAARAALGHTRWATHGGVTEANAHPHVDCQGRLAIIHNGIIENHAELRRELVALGHTFASQTDTEVVCHLLEEELTREADAEDAANSDPCHRLAQVLMSVFRRLDGLSAIGVLDPQLDCIAAAKNGSPLVLGWGNGGNFLASDSSALLDHTRRLTFLEDGQAALITRDSLTVYDVISGDPIAKPRVWDITWEQEVDSLDGYPHYMAKEIAEQPPVLRRLAAERAEAAQRLADSILAASTVHLVGCGSASNAARCGEYLFSRVASRQANCVVGSEFGYLADFLDERSLVVGLSQSGETIDLLDSMKSAQRRGAKLSALVNVEGSSLYRLVDDPILLSAGPERCVLATKSFTAKLGVLVMAAYAARGRLEAGRALLEQAADEIQSLLSDGRVEQIRALARRIADAEHLYVIGRGPSYPMALEAALKIKEVSYMHAEGFAGGELKHGVIALIDSGTPCIVLAPNDETFRAILSGAEEIKARGGRIIGISPFASDVWDEHIPVADVGEAASIVNAVPAQVLAYELALARGLDPDKPRNLAKSVTVK